MASPFTWSKTSPADTDKVSAYPALARARQVTLGDSATGGVIGTLVPTGTPTTGWRVVQDADEISMVAGAYYSGTAWVFDNPPTNKAYRFLYSQASDYFSWQRAPASANPPVFAELMRLTGTGVLVLSNYIAPPNGGSYGGYGSGASLGIRAGANPPTVGTGGFLVVQRHADEVSGGAVFITGSNAAGTADIEHFIVPGGQDAPAPGSFGQGGTVDVVDVGELELINSKPATAGQYIASPVLSLVGRANNAGADSQFQWQLASNMYSIINSQLELSLIPPSVARQALVQFLARNPTVAAANYWQVVSGASTGNAVSIQAAGSDTDVQANFFSQGNGAVVLGSTLNGPVLRLGPVTSGVDYFQLNPSSTANPATISLQAIGSDANVNINLISKGTGNVQVGSVGFLQFLNALVTLGGGAAPTFGTIGGAGPATAAQNAWLKLIDSTGASFWVPTWK